MKKNVKKIIIKHASLLYEKGFVNTFEGNLSIKKGKYIYITGSNMSKRKLTENMIAVIDSNGNQIDGSRKGSSEIPMHMFVYKIRPDITAVIHSHAPYLTAYALCNKPLTTDAYPEMIGNFKEIPVVKYGRPGTIKIAEGLKDVISNHNIVLLANHGVLSVGKDLFQAFSILEACEAIAKVLTLAKQIGEIVPLDENEYKWLYNYKSPLLPK